uniref:Uncharacterized protein n=1 Tax=Manihot esculenta TaxID=3983 RepID=A0A2C9VH36_MANES
MENRSASFSQLQRCKNRDTILIVYQNSYYSYKNGSNVECLIVHCRSMHHRRQ